MNDKRLVLLDEQDISTLKALNDWLPRFLESVSENSIHFSDITQSLMERPKDLNE